MKIQTTNTGATEYKFSTASLFVKSEEKNGSVYWYADNSDNMKKVTTRTSRGCGRISRRVGNPWKRISKKVAAEILSKWEITLEQFVAYENGELEIVENSEENINNTKEENKMTNSVAILTATAEEMEEAIRLEEETAEEVALEETNSETEENPETQCTWENPHKSESVGDLTERALVASNSRLAAFNEHEIKPVQTKAQKARARWTKALETAKLDESGKMQLYILYAECGNDCMAYVINTKGKKVRIQSKLAYQLIQDGRAVKITTTKAA